MSVPETPAENWELRLFFLGVGIGVVLSLLAFGLIDRIAGVC